MSANPKIYTNALCTNELATDNGNYVLQLGADTGLNGNTGDTATKQLWLKNTGDETYQNATLTESADTAGRISYSLDDSTYHSSTIDLGDITAGDDITFYVKVTVEENATAGRKTFGFGISGESI